MSPEKKHVLTDVIEICGQSIVTIVSGRLYLFDKIPNRLSMNDEFDNDSVTRQDIIYEGSDLPFKAIWIDEKNLTLEVYRTIRPNIKTSHRGVNITVKLIDPRTMK
jgi:hypothetical protein